MAIRLFRIRSRFCQSDQIRSGFCQSGPVRSDPIRSDPVRSWFWLRPQINDLCKRTSDLYKRTSDLCKRIELDVTTSSGRCCVVGI